MWRLVKTKKNYIIITFQALRKFMIFFSLTKYVLWYNYFLLWKNIIYNAFLIWLITNIHTYTHTYIYTTHSSKGKLKAKTTPLTMASKQASYRHWAPLGKPHSGTNPSGQASNWHHLHDKSHDTSIIVSMAPNSSCKAS